MKRIDRIKLNFTRNWGLPGKERLSGLLKPSQHLKNVIKDGIVWLTGEDIAIYTSADSYIEWAILSGGTYEEEINKLIRISLKDGDNALDIGANIGLQSIRMSQCAGKNGRVFAFEPLVYLQEKLKRNLSLNRVENVKLFPFALADAGGETEFTINKHSWNQGTFSLNNTAEGTEKQLVVIKAGDEMPEIQQLDALQLIKIDVEGFEFQVLKGLKETIKRHRPRIIFEYDENYWKNSGQDMNACQAFFKTMNYTLFQITPVGCELITGIVQPAGGNLFCIPA